MVFSSLVLRLPPSVWTLTSDVSRGIFSSLVLQLPPSVWTLTSDVSRGIFSSLVLQLPPSVSTITGPHLLHVSKNMLVAFSGNGEGQRKRLCPISPKGHWDVNLILCPRERERERDM